MSLTLYFATSNSDKVREAQAILGLPIQQISMDIPEIQSLDVEEVVRVKALAAYNQTGKMTMVEDTGLYLDAWNGLPGAFIRWFLKTVKNDGICRMLASEVNRKATAKTSVAFFDGSSHHVFSGEVHGTVPLVPVGDSGFGWDSIFQPDECGKTFAQMTDEAKNQISMRRIALEKLRQYLTSASLWRRV